MLSWHTQSVGPRITRVSRAAAVLAVAAAAGLSAAAQDRRAWLDYGGGPDNSKYTSLKQIDTSNVSTLQVAWTYPYGETGFNPIVARGVIYGKGRSGALVALDAATGKARWIHDKLAYALPAKGK